MSRQNDEAQAADAGNPARFPAPFWFLHNSLEIAAGLMLVAICLIIFAGVFFRYFLHIGLGWTEEAARYLQVWMTFIGATIAVKRWSHFQLSIVNQWIPRGARRYTRIFAIVVVILLGIVMVKNGIEITSVSWQQTSPIMSWNIGYLYVVVPFSGVLMILFALRHLVDAILNPASDADAGSGHGVAPPPLPAKAE